MLRGETPVHLRRQADSSERRARARRRGPSARGASLDIAPHETALWDALRDLRARLAREQGVPAYVIFHDATLLAMLRERPQTLATRSARSAASASASSRATARRSSARSPRAFVIPNAHADARKGGRGEWPQPQPAELLEGSAWVGIPASSIA